MGIFFFGKEREVADVWRLRFIFYSPRPCLKFSRKQVSWIFLEDSVADAFEVEHRKKVTLIHV